MRSIHDIGLDKIEEPDAKIRATNDDAALSKLSAVNLGYLHDPYVEHFVRSSSRRAPIINRGTYVRTRAIDALIKTFLRTPIPDTKKKQIVSLGAGFDTRYFYLQENENLLSDVFYIELDFVQITSKKASIIKRSKKVSQQLKENIKILAGGTGLLTDSYLLMQTDLRQFSKTWQEMIENGFDPSLPTLFLSECVLVYLDVTQSDFIINYAAKECTSEVMFVVYEQINPDDSFGKVMIQNLRNRQIFLPGLETYRTLQDQESRFLKSGYDSVSPYTIHEIHNTRIPKEELARIAKLEMLDEVEEWNLLAQHYCIVVASKNASEQKSNGEFSKNICISKETW